MTGEDAIASACIARSSAAKHDFKAGSGRPNGVARRALALGKGCVDVSMLALLLYLMGYRAGSGLLSHAVCGAILIVLFAVHLLLNIRWLAALRRGRYGVARALNTAVDLALALCLVGLAASSAMMAGYVLPMWPLSMPWYARTLHMASSAWCVLLMAFHVGLHAHTGLRRLWARLPEAGAARRIWLVSALGVCALGAWCAVSGGLLENLVTFDGASSYGFGSVGSDASLYARTLGTVAGMCSVAHLVQLGLQRIRQVRAKRRS